MSTNSATTHYRMELNNKIQGKFHGPPKEYSDWNINHTGPQDSGEWIATVTIEGSVYEGRHQRKDDAAELASKSALDGHSWGN